MQIGGGALPSPFSGEMIAGAARDRAQPPSPASTQTSEEARRVAEEFEAMALAEMLQPIFAQINPRGLGGGGAGEEMFRPMLVQEYAAAMAKAGGVGLADAVVRELTRLQAAASAEGTNQGGLP